MPASLRVLALTCSALACSALACAPPVAATPYPSEPPPEGEPEAKPEAVDPNVVRFLGREVDLGPFLEGFPYEHFTPSLEHDRLYFVETGDRYVLRALALPEDPKAPLDLSAAEAVTEVDWSKRSLWTIRVHGASDTLWLHADANNDEQMNLWRVDLSKQSAAEREPEQLTFADYVYGFGFSEDEKQVAYLARTGQKAPYETCLRLLDATDPKREGADQRVVCDTPALSFTWSTPRFSPDGERVYFAAQIEGDRKRVQIVEVRLDRERPTAKIITDPDKPRSTPNLLEGWVDGDKLLYTANDEGFGNVYSWSRKTRKSKRLTNHKEALLDAATLEVDGQTQVFVAHGTPAGSTVELLDAKSGELRGRAEVPGRVGILDGHGDRAIWAQRAPDKVYEANLAHFRKAEDGLELDNTALVRLNTELEDQLVRCEAEAVKIPTFDERELHTFVLRPKQPLPEGQAVAMVRSFYGGANAWTRYDHILCAAGITVVSPSVRGSSGFGKEFYGLNDRDLGGDEIVDLFWVARWVENELGIPNERVGVYGRSHGGYATMRAMTFPPQTNERNESYRFAFGLAEAGFSDIVAFHDASNIPDWVVLEAGDPKVPEDLARLQDRSPLNHVELLDAPIFLLHGSNDWRVPVEGSRAFAEAAEAAGKPVVYVEVEGQGHHVEGQERIVAAWQARLDFIESVVGPKGEGEDEANAKADAKP